MNNYTIESARGKHKIVEKQTKHVVFECRNKRKAHKKLAFFNMGGAFDGWTPTFFLVNIVIPDVE